MGVGFSTFSNGVFVQCDTREYVAGDVVRAVVALHVGGAPLDLFAMHLELVGTERTMFPDRGSRYGGSHRATVVFVREKTVLQHSRGMFGPGQHQWQVALRLPASLPGILGEENAWRGRACSVKYELRATCVAAGKPKEADVFSSPAPLRVLAPAPATPPVGLRCSYDAPIFTCCCLGRGTVCARLTVDREWALRGEELGLTVEVDNRSTAAVRRMRVALRKTCEMRRESSGDRMLHKGETFHTHMAVQHLECVPARTAAVGGQARHTTLRLPTTLQPSHKGAALTLAYAVELTLKMGLWSRNVHLRVPVRVFIPPCKPASSQDGTGGGHVGSVSARIRAAGRAAQLPPQGEEDREPPFTWAPHIVYAPAAWQLPDAEPVPPEALQPDGSFFLNSNS